ncbi:MAG: hypothetical protein ACJASR_000254 [Psychroserpens sp.]|jgi:hypothetical protein
MALSNFILNKNQYKYDPSEDLEALIFVFEDFNYSEWSKEFTNIFSNHPNEESSYLTNSQAVVKEIKLTENKAIFLYEIDNLIPKYFRHSQNITLQGLNKKFIYPVFQKTLTSVTKDFNERSDDSLKKAYLILFWDNLEIVIEMFLSNRERYKLLRDYFYTLLVGILRLTKSYSPFINPTNHIRVKKLYQNFTRIDLAKKKARLFTNTEIANSKQIELKKIHDKLIKNDIITESFTDFQTVIEDLRTDFKLVKLKWSSGVYQLVALYFILREDFKVWGNVGSNKWIEFDESFEHKFPITPDYRSVWNQTKNNKNKYLSEYRFLLIH